MKKILLFLVTFISLIIWGQKDENFNEPCATQFLHNKMMQSDSKYAQKYEAMLIDIAEKIKNTPVNKNNPVYQIPVVVHIIHNGESVGTIYNPSDTSIQNMITDLNNWYRNTGNRYNVNGKDIGIEFVLAKRAPNCNATNGINRINGSNIAGYTQYGVKVQGTNGAAEIDIKNLNRWDPYSYYNIWVVNKIDGADGVSGSGSYIAGFAYYPIANASLDGTIMLASHSTGNSFVLPHEIGHALNLVHTFEGSSGIGVCATNTDCTTQGDYVCDTAPHDANHFQCTSNACSSDLTVLQNIMSYNCQSYFTEGQKTRMRTSLVNLRNSLINSLGDTPPDGTSISSACTPTFTNNHTGVGITDFLFPNKFYNYSSTSGFEGNIKDFSCNLGLDLYSGSSNQIIVGTSVNPHNVKVYIDFNKDGDFLDINENVFSGVTVNPNGINDDYYFLNSTLSIPSSVPYYNEKLRMRVVADWTGFVQPTACSLQYGQSEDYYVKILPSNWANLQWPQNATINFNATTNVYGQIFAPGKTDTSSGQAAGIQSWTGISSNNTNPNTWAESSWKSSTFNMEVGNNDEYKTTVGFISETGDNYVLPGVYYYATRFKVDSEAYLYGGNNLNAGANAGGIWDGATYKSGTLTVLTQVMPDLCGTTFTHQNNRIDAIPVTGATHYKFKFVNGATTTEITSTTSGVAFADLGAALVYGATYQVSVAWSTDSGATYTAFGGDCNVTLAGATTQLVSNSCNLSTDNPNIRLEALPLTGATEYTFEFTNTTTNAVTEVVSATEYTTFGTAAVPFGTYSIKVKAKIGGTYGSYGTACTNSYLPVTSKVLASQCGTTMDHSYNLIFAEARTGATSWKFKFVEGTNTQEITRSSNDVTFASLGSALKYNTNYSISVSYEKDGVWSGYGPACDVMVGNNTYVTVGCGATYTGNERIEALPILNATEYTFEFNSGGTTYVSTNEFANFGVAGLGAGTYSVRVKAMVNGTYGNYSTACDVTYSPAASLANARVMVYPNPFTQGFTIDTSNMKQASITIYDQNALVKEQHNVTAPSQSLKMGTTLAKGIYFVHVTQNGNTEVYQVIKK